VLLRRQLGRLGLFLEVNGKNYLSETRLKQLEAQPAARQTANETRKTRLTLRIVRALISILVVTLLLVNFFVHRLELRLVPSGLLVAVLGVSLLQLYPLTRLINRRPILSE
jgi:membrane protein YdbS with pleckstrin-like domain